MPDTSDLVSLATRAVVALERIAEHLDAPASELRTKGVVSKCGCTYAAEVGADGKVVERGVWQREVVCEHHARERGFMTGDMFQLGRPTDGKYLVTLSCSSGNYACAQARRDLRRYHGIELD